MSQVEEARAAYEQAHEKAVSLSNEYTEARAAVKETYDGKIKEANQELVEAEKVLNDAEAAAALVGRDDAKYLAVSLGLELPE